MPDVEVVVTPTPPVQVEVEDASFAGQVVTVELSPPPPSVVEVVVPGPQGEKGDPGDVVGGMGDAHYAHLQSTPDTAWTIEHNLGKYPAIQTFDSAGTQVEGDVVHVSETALTVEFAYPFSGTAYCN